MKAVVLLKRHYVTFIAVVLLILPILIHNEYIYHISIMCGIYALLTISLNLITGFTGQLSLGHVAFYCIGAYSSALISLNLGIPVFLSMLMGAAISAFFGFLIGFPALRLSGVYLGIATLGFAEIVRQVVLIWVDLTRGPMGLPGIPRASLFGFVFERGLRSYILILIIVAIVYFFIHRFVQSRTGVILVSIRDDETAAASMGVNVAFYKVLTFVISAFVAGLAGAFFAQFSSFISPSNFMSAESYLILSMYALGGPASLPGSVGGAIVLTLASELLRSFQEWRQVLYAVLLVGVVLFKPSGISGLLGKHRILAGMPRRASDLILTKYGVKEDN